eukprot:g15821.t1
MYGYASPISRVWDLFPARKVVQDPIAAPGADPERQEQQDWAARFLRDKMERINNQTARSPAMIRLAAINKAQLLFRHFRQDHIFDRSYALGTNVNTRVQQMMKGVSMMGSFSSLSTREVLHMALRGEGLNAFFEDIDMYINSKASSYSEAWGAPEAAGKTRRDGSTGRPAEESGQPLSSLGERPTSHVG